jgi:hypothetical protein
LSAVTSDDGIIFVQAKRSVDMSSTATSSFAGALDQFVRQVKACAAADPKHAWSRPAGILTGMADLADVLAGTLKAPAADRQHG